MKFLRAARSARSGSSKFLKKSDPLAQSGDFRQPGMADVEECISQRPRVSLSHCFHRHLVVAARQGLKVQDLTPEPVSKFCWKRPHESFQINAKNSWQLLPKRNSAGPFRLVDSKFHS